MRTVILLYIVSQGIQIGVSSLQSINIQIINISIYPQQSLMKHSILVILACMCLCVSSIELGGYEIIKADRIVQLTGAYPTQGTTLRYICKQETCSNFVVYAIPNEYSTKVNKISFTKTKDSVSSYPTQIINHKHNGQEYDLHRVELPNNHKKDQQFTVYAKVIYINRYVNYPESISLSQDQKFEYEDTKDIVAPYKIKQSSTTYKFSKILQFDEEGEKKGVSGAVFKGTDVEAFTSSQKIVVHGVNNEPQVVFSEVERVIEVSHWGNIAIVQFYKLKNTGPQLKGEFSRIQFGSQNSFESKNAFRGIETSLPYEIWGLYYRDQVGNISTSKAYRDDRRATVQFTLTPRYALLGGWKCNWEIGYNLDTKGFLTHNGNNFNLTKIPIEYAFSKILTQKYKIRVILPEGSVNTEFQMDGTPIDMNIVEESSNFGYLDFVGRPQYIIPDLKGNFANKELQVKYNYESTNIFKKPLLIFGAIFSVFFLFIVIKRLNLSTFTQQTHAKIN